MSLPDNYRIDEFGVIHQIEFTPITYDKKYLTYYEDLSDRTIKLGYQRMGWVLGLMGRIPSSVLEIGYGTGTFIEAAHITGVAGLRGLRYRRLSAAQRRALSRLGVPRLSANGIWSRCSMCWSTFRICRSSPG